MRFSLQDHAEEVAAKYLSGESTPRIAAFYGVSEKSVNQCLRKLWKLKREQFEAKIGYAKMLPKA